MDARMRILYFSDIHIDLLTSKTRIPWCDIYPLDLGPCLTEYVGHVDLVILAGDIAQAAVREHQPYEVATATYAQQVAAYLGRPVIVVPGNHEYYGFNFDEARPWMAAQTTDTVAFLDRDKAIFHKAGEKPLRILGATLWTDYKVDGGAYEVTMMNLRKSFPDHRHIGMSGGFQQDFFLPEHALAEHQLSRRWLIDMLDEPHDGPTLIVSHHCPHSVVNNRAYNTHAGFSSDCDDVLQAADGRNVVAWIYGHNHYSGQWDAWNVPLLSAQWGYHFEQEDKTRWDGPGILEI